MQENRLVHLSAAGGAAGRLAEGRLEEIADGLVSGWAWCPADDAVTLSVVVLVDGRAVAETVADLPRPSLAAAGKGSGAHGFVVALPESLADRGSHNVRVVAGPQHVALPAANGFVAVERDRGRFAGTAFRAVDQLGGDGAARSGRAPVTLPGHMLAAVRLGPRMLADRTVSKARTWPRSPTALLVGGCAFYFVWFVYLTRHHGFFEDEWEFLIDRRAWNPDAFLAPHVQSLLLLPVLVYKLLFVTVGVRTTWPYRVVVFALHDVCVAGVYVLARRRAGGWRALVPAGLLLALGAGWEDELWAMQMSFLASISAGLWGLVCLEREDRRGDIAAAALVTVSLASSSVGLPFTAAIGATLAAFRWRRLWVVAVPLLLYLLWLVGYGQSAIVWANIVHVPGYDVRIGGYGFAGLLGLSSYTIGTGGPILDTGVAMLTVACVWLLRRLVRSRRLPPLALTGIAGALALWTATALARYQYRQPDSSQYVYPSAVFILLGAIAFMRWRPIRLRVAAAVAIAGAVVAVVGDAPLRQYASNRDGFDALVGSELGATLLAGTTGNPAYVPDRRRLAYVSYGALRRLAQALGSPVDTPDQLASAPTDDRLAADAALIGVERIGPRTAPATIPSCPSWTAVATASTVTVGLNPGQTLYTRASRRTRVTLSLRRLSAVVPSTPQFTLTARRSMTAVPRDTSPIPWRVALTASVDRSVPAASVLLRYCVS